MSNLFFLRGLLRHTFENFKQMLTLKLCYEDRSGMITEKLMPLKFRFILIIWLGDVNNSASLMNHTRNAMIKKTMTIL